MSCSERLLTLALLLGAPMALPAAEPLRLTHDGTRKMTPTFADGGEQIVFAKHERPNLVALMRMRAKGGPAERIFPELVNHQFDPTVSPDGRFLAYGRSESNPQMVLVIRDTRESKEFVYRPKESRATARSPSIAPDGSRVAFGLTEVDGGSRIASVDLKGEGLRTLSQSAGANSWPAYSPDGRSIAFGSSRDGDFEIYVMDADGAHVRRLTRSPGRDMRPVWSPDGERIAFVSTRDGDEEVYVMNVDGSNPRNVTNQPGRDTDPAWHPDGRHLLFVSERRGKIDLYLAEVAD